MLASGFVAFELLHCFALQVFRPGVSPHCLALGGGAFLLLLSAAWGVVGGVMCLLMSASWGVISGSFVIEKHVLEGHLGDLLLNIAALGVIWGDVSLLISASLDGHLGDHFV